MLEDCPLCTRIRDNKTSQRGEHCVAMDLDGVRVVALLRHDPSPTAVEAVEAWKMANPGTGIAKGVDVPGHWAISVHSDGDWLVGKSQSHSDNPKSA